MPKLIVRFALLIVCFCFPGYAGDKSAPAAFARLRAKVESLGFSPLDTPLKLRKKEPPAFTRAGKPDVSDLKLYYELDDLRAVPENLAIELDEKAFAGVANRLQGLADSALPAREMMEAGPEAVYRMKLFGLAAQKLVGLEFLRPLHGKKGNLTEWKLAFTTLTVRRLSLEITEIGQRPRPVLQAHDLILGGQYRQMKIKTKKKKVEFKKGARVIKLGMKLKDPRRKRIGLGFPRPESGEDLSMLVATVGHRRLEYRIEPVIENSARIDRFRKPRRWVFIGTSGAKYDEVILPSQFDGKSALGIFLRVLDHKKEPFRPRTRSARFEAILAEVAFE